MSGVVEKSALPAVPPGILRHLEESNAQIRRMVDESIDAYFAARSMLTQPILSQHLDLRWRYRRELKKTLEKSYLAGVEHIRSCDRCRTWLAALNREFASILASSEKPPSK